MTSAPQLRGWLVLFAFLFLMSFLPGASQSLARGPERDVDSPACVTRTPALRTGSPACWVRLRWDHPGSLCMTRPLWRRWLEKNADGSRCENLRGRWKIRYPLVNNGDAHQGGESRGKIPEMTFQARSVPAPGSVLPVEEDGWISRLFTKFWRVLESRRERAATLLEPVDPLGIFRKLLLDENMPAGPGGMLRLLGFVHLLTATGIHLYALATIWGTVISRLAAAFSLPLRFLLPLSRAVIFLSWITAWTLSGLRLGMLRPWIIVLARKSAEIAGFRWRRWSPLAVALIADLAAGILLRITQGQPFDEGRWFYALAVGGGMLGGSSHLLLAVSAWVFPALVEAARTGLVAVATPLLSFVTIPVFSLLVFPMLLLCSTLLDLDCQAAATRLTALVAPWALEILRRMTSLSLGAKTLWTVPRWSVAISGICAIALSVLWAYPHSRKKHWKICLAAVTAALLVRGASRCWSAAAQENPVAFGADSVEQLDVGQGDAALVLYHRHGLIEAGLIDSGPEGALPDQEWIRILASRGVHGLSWVGITHLDMDHAGGVKRLVRLFPIRCISTAREQLETERGDRFSEELRMQGVPVQENESGCVPFPFYTARTPASRSTKENANMTSFYIPLIPGGFYLSPGDADQEDEPRIARWALKQTETSLNSTGVRNAPRILKIGHHGSKTATRSEFLEMLHPTETWISVGAGNSYGHPAQVTLDTLERYRLPVRRTDRDGSLRVP